MTFKESLELLRINLEKELEILEKAARSDDKTPLQNALAYNEAKEKFGISDENANVIVFADIDKFKNVNSQYGQIAGDLAITKIGELMESSFIEKFQSQGFRISGDEFVLLFNDLFLNEFKKYSSLFQNYTIPFFDSNSEEKTFSVKVSFGIALNDTDCDFQTLRDRAELACKKAKTLSDQRYFEWTSEIERYKTRSFRVTCPNCETITNCDVLEQREEKILSLRCPICGKYVSLEN